MKNNQVYLDPKDIDNSMRQVMRFYRLDEQTTEMLRRVVERYPRPVIMYVDEANAPYFASSALDDLFTFNTETDELVLFSSDPHTFVNALIEMWMYVEGFHTLMGEDDYWKVEFAIGSWKPVRDNIKRSLGIDVNNEITGVVGLPPEPDEIPLEDPYPFRTLVSTLNIISFTQMIRFAGREEIRVHFPKGTSPRVIEVYRAMRKAMNVVGEGLEIEDVEEFNKRLQTQINFLERRYNPSKLPIPNGWQFSDEDEGDKDTVSSPSSNVDNEGIEDTNFLLGSPKDEPEIGRLFETPPDEEDDNRPPPQEWSRDLRDSSRIDEILAKGPFADFIDTLFEDES